MATLTGAAPRAATAPAPYEGVLLGNDWAHFIRKFDGGEYSKYANNWANCKTCVTKCLRDLRACISKVSFFKLAERVKQVVVALGEGRLWAVLEKSYIKDWGWTWSRAAVEPGCLLAGQQPVENDNRGTKLLLRGTALLKATPQQFADETLPMKLSVMTENLLKIDPASVSSVALGPASSNIVCDAQLRLERAKPAYVELGSKPKDDVRTFFINSEACQRVKMTKTRAKAAQKFMVDGVLPELVDLDKAMVASSYDTLRKITLVNRVTATKVDDPSLLNPWCQIAGPLFDIADGGGLYRFACTCPEFYTGANRCPCSIAIACEMGSCKLEQLLDKAPVTTRVAGRPRKDRGPLDRGQGPRTRFTCAWFENDILTSRIGKYHHCNVALPFEDDEWHVGYVNAFKEVFTEDGEKDFLFEIKFQGWENPNNEKHQIRTHELAQGLADAQALGVAHRVDFSKSHHVSVPFPAAGADDDVSMEESEPEEDAVADGTDDATDDAMEEEA
jgi:hypothetical protein